MSYEKKMLEEYKMPSRVRVEEALLKSIFKYNGIIKEFGDKENIVEEIAEKFQLSQVQKSAYLETIYLKENRKKRSSLWHRLLFRAADSLAKQKYITRPTQTYKLTNKREWMLTEAGYEKTLELQHIPLDQKEILPVKSFEIQKIVNKLKQSPRPINYIPFDDSKKKIQISREMSLRSRGFRMAVLEAYDYKCAVCGLKLKSPSGLLWEVEAAHIVPHSAMGKDDIWNGISMCHLHHWAFDVGWFTLTNDFQLTISSHAKDVSADHGYIDDFNFFNHIRSKSKIDLPFSKELFPHVSSIDWHRNNIFSK